MNDSSSKPHHRDLHMAAVVSSAVIIAGFAVYWYVQILDTLEMLELAYG